MRTVYYREEFIIDHVKNQKTLSVGLGGQLEDVIYSFNLNKTQDISFTVSSKIFEAASEAHFIDISAEAIKLFSKQLDTKYYLVDITSPMSRWPTELLEQKYDVIVLGEVLEHIDSPGLALKNIKNLLAENGILVITVPNAFFISGLIKTMIREEFIHQEHVCYYSPKTLARLLNVCGFSVDHVAWSRWSRFEANWLTHRLSHLIAHFASLLFPSLSEGVVAIARPK